jgi:hypothetical protein
MHRCNGGRHGFEIQLEVGIRTGLHVRQEVRQVIAVVGLIGSALCPDAVLLHNSGLSQCSKARSPTMRHGKLASFDHLATWSEQAAALGKR